MNRAVSDRRRRLHFLLAWTRAEPGRAALWTLVFIAVVTTCLALFGAPSWATSRRFRSSRSAQPIKLRTHLIVDTTSDESTDGDGMCSLREAITTSNDAGGFTNDCGTGSGFDEITFSVSGTITLGSALPTITQNLIVDGTGQTVAINGASKFQVFMVKSGATLALSNLTIQNGNGGSSVHGGGGVENNGALTVSNCQVQSNSASNNSGAAAGGGIFNNVGATLTVTNSSISSNVAQVDGGIANEGTLTLANSSIFLNIGGEGGGIGNGGSLTMTGSTIEANQTVGGPGLLAIGAGIVNAGPGIATVTNSTIAANSAQDSGGAIANLATLTVTNSTIWGNGTFQLVGGGVVNFVSGSASTFKNTIFAMNQNGNCFSKTGATFTSDGHNLSDDTTCDAFLTGIGDLNNTPAGLDPVGINSNGGPTQTVALLPTSPAVDAVPTSPTNYCTEIDGTTPITTDQRGMPRPDTEDSDLASAACDIGAFELSTTEATPTATATSTPTTTSTPSGTATSTSIATPSGTATATPTTTATPTATATTTATATSTPTSTPTPVAGKLKVSPKILKFGSVSLNALPKMKTVTVTNAGKIKKKNHPLPILIEMESVDGMPMPSPFSVASSHCDDDNLMPGGKGVPKSETTCTIEVQFKPTEAVSYSGRLMIFDNLAPSEMQTVQMTGKGKAAK